MEDRGGVFASYLAELVCPNWEQEQIRRDRSEEQETGV